MSENINRVTITGNLTRDPELRFTASGVGVCELGVAVNGRRKDSSGTWVDKPNFFNVVVWGKQGEACSEYLRKGSPVAVDGKLDWQQWEAKDGSGKRSAVKIVADSVQFLSQRGSSDDGFTPASQETRVSGDVARQDAAAYAPDSTEDDDIPF